MALIVPPHLAACNNLPMAGQMRRWAWVLVLVAAALPLWRALVLGEAIGPFDQIAAMRPWNQAPKDQPWDVLQADGALQFYGWRDLVFESWGRFQVPAWNPYQLGGTPLLANSQSAALYPPHIVAGVLHLPTALAMALLAWLHLAWAGIGVFELSRRLGASWAGASVAAVSFSLSPFMVAWVGLPSVVTTVSWIPWLLLGVIGAFTGERPLRLGAAIGVCGGMMLLSGHLQFAAYGFMAAVLAALWLAVFRPERAKPAVGLAVCGAGLVLAGLVAAPQVVPVLQYSKFSHRSNVASAEGYNAYISSALRPFELATIPAPTVLGHPARKSSAIDGLSTYWPATAKLGGNFAEAAIGLGPVVLFLLLAVPWRRLRSTAAMGVAFVGAIAFLLATGSPLNRLLYFGVPGWSSSGSPGRVGVLFVLAACVLCSLGLTPVEGVKRPWLKPLLVGGVLFIAAIQVPLFQSVTPWIPQLDPEMKRYMGSTLFDAGAPLLIALSLGAVALLTTQGDRRTRAVAVGCAVVAPCVLYALDLVRTAPMSLTKLEGIGRYERVAALNEPWDILGRYPALLPPNTATILRMHDLGGYDSLLHRDTVQLLREANGQDPAPPANGNMMFVKPSASPQALMDAGVTQVLAPAPWGQAPTPPTVDTSGFARYALEGPGRASVDGRPAEIVDETAGSITVRATGPGTLMLRERAIGEWKATIGGVPVEVTQDRWLSLALPEGEQTVAFRHRPAGFPVGLGLGVLGMALLALMALLGSRNPPGGKLD